MEDTERTFRSLEKITHLHLPKWLSALARGRTPRGCCRLIKGQLPWAGLLQRDGSEVSLGRKRSCFGSTNVPPTNTPLLLQGWPLLPPWPRLGHHFVFHFTAAAENSCLDSSPHLTRPSYLPGCPLLFQRVGLNNINASLRIESHACRLRSTRGRAGTNESLLHIFKENAFSNQIFDDFNFPLWASSGIIIPFMWTKVHWLH